MDRIQQAARGILAKVEAELNCKENYNFNKFTIEELQQISNIYDRDILKVLKSIIDNQGRYNSFERAALGRLQYIMKNIIDGKTEKQATEFRKLCRCVRSELGHNIDGGKESMHGLFNLADDVIRNLEANNFRARLESSQERSQESRNTDSRSHTVSREANILS